MNTDFQSAQGIDDAATFCSLYVVRHSRRFIARSPARNRPKQVVVDRDFLPVGRNIPCSHGWQRLEQSRSDDSFGANSLRTASMSSLAIVWVLVGKFSLPTPMAKTPSSLQNKMATVLLVGCQTANGSSSTPNVPAAHKSM